MQAFGVKIVALLVVMMLVSSTLALPDHVIGKRSSEEIRRPPTSTNTNNMSMSQFTELLQLLKVFKDLFQKLLTPTQ